MEFAHRQEQSSPFASGWSARPVSHDNFESESGRHGAPHQSAFMSSPVHDPEVLQCRLDLMSHWADEPDHRRETSKKQRTNRPRSAFDRLTGGEQGTSVAMNKAPSQLVLPREMTQALQVAWNQSLPQGQAKEQGGLLVRNRDGSMRWLRAAPGTEKEISLNYDEVSPQQTLLAGAHTHPYGAEEFDFTDVPFSGRDLAELVDAPHRLSIVQSGEALFGAARTREFDALVKSRDEAGRQSLSNEIERFWQTIYDAAEGGTPEKSEAATRATSEWFHLLYYAGKQGTMRRVDTSVNTEAGGR